MQQLIQYIFLRAKYVNNLWIYFLIKYCMIYQNFLLIITHYYFSLGVKFILQRLARFIILYMK